MAQIGQAPSPRHPAGPAWSWSPFVLIIAGLLIKSAIVPFHFWLADAHAVAPTPVCVLFSGVMVELGLYGIARVYWSIFGQALGHRAAVTHVVPRPRRADRDRRGAVLLPRAAHQAAARLLHDQPRRHVPHRHRAAHPARAGRRRRLRDRARAGQGGAVPVHRNRAAPAAARSTRPGCTAGAAGCGSPAWSSPWPRLGLADLPPFATFLGKGWIEDSAAARGMAWITASLVLASGPGRRGRAAGRRRRLLRAGRPARREPARWPGSPPRRPARPTSGQAAHPAHHDRPAGRAGRRRRRRGCCRRLGPRSRRPRCASRTRPATTRPCCTARTSRTRWPCLAAGPAGVTAADLLTGAGLGRRGPDPRRLALYWRRLPLLRAGPAERRARAAAPPLPERRGQRLRDLDRHRPGLPRRHIRRHYRLIPGAGYWSALGLSALSASSSIAGKVSRAPHLGR